MINQYSNKLVKRNLEEIKKKKKKKKKKKWRWIIILKMERRVKR